MRMVDPERVGRARFWVGWSLFFEGNLVAALEEFEQASKLSVGAPSKREVAVWNWRSRSRSLASLTLWGLGYPERAMARSRESFAVARDPIAPPGDLAVALFWSAILNRCLGNPKTAYANADEAKRLAHEQGLTSILAVLGLERGCALAQLGQIEEGLSEIMQWRTELRQTIGPGLFLALAVLYLTAGRRLEGLETVSEGLELIHRTRARYLEAEMRRLKGELLLIGDDSAAIEAAQCFRDGIEVARRQSAKSWELRATMSLARLLAQQNRRDEARAALASVYGWFTEGFETADLKDAKRLLEELSA